MIPWRWDFPHAQLMLRLTALLSLLSRTSVLPLDIASQMQLKQQILWHRPPSFNTKVILWIAPVFHFAFPAYSFANHFNIGPMGEFSKADIVQGVGTRDRWVSGSNSNILERGLPPAWAQREEWLQFWDIFSFGAVLLCKTLKSTSFWHLLELKGSLSLCGELKASARKIHEWSVLFSVFLHMMGHLGSSRGVACGTLPRQILSSGYSSATYSPTKYIAARLDIMLHEGCCYLRCSVFHRCDAHRSQRAGLWPSKIYSSLHTVRS